MLGKCTTILVAGGEPGYQGFDRFVTTSLGEKFNKRLNLIIDH